MTTTDKITDYREQLLKELAKAAKEKDDLADAPESIKEGNQVEQK